LVGFVEDILGKYGLFIRQLIREKEAFFEKNVSIGVAIYVKRRQFMKALDIKVTVNSSELLWSYSIPAL
jgi:hypothetical protein